MERSHPLEMDALLGEILMKVGCVKSIFRSTLVSKFWLKTARSSAVVAGFAEHNKRYFLGFISESRAYDGDKVQLFWPANVPANGSVQSMRSNFEPSCLSGLYVLGCHGGRLICRMEVNGGICMICPYAAASALEVVARPIPAVEPIPGKVVLRPYGQFAILPPSECVGRSHVGFFIREMNASFIRRPEGVRFHADSNVCVHVQVFRNNIWNPALFGPLARPAHPLFHKHPYCVEASSMVYIMYVVGHIVCFDPEEGYFEVIDLPGEMGVSVKSGLDYSVASDLEGQLVLVHVDNGVLVKWVLSKGDPEGWHIETSVDLPDAFTEMLNNDIILAARAGAIDWESIQVRCVCSDARFVLIGIGLRQGVFIVDIVDMLQRRGNRPGKAAG